MTNTDRLFVDKLADLIATFEGGQTNGKHLADALIDSGIFFEAEVAAWREGYSAGNLDGYFGTHKEYDKKFGEGAFHRD